MTKAPVFAALDTTETETAVRLTKAVQPHLAGVKLGLEFFLSEGRAGYEAVKACGAPVFLDLKLHDIPNTVAGGIKAVADLTPHYLTIHTQGGPEMIKRAVETAQDLSPATSVLGVTILTSLDAEDLTAMGVGGPVTDQVRRLAGMGAEAGLKGFVCAPSDVANLRSDLGPEISLVVPGIRPAGSAAGDQKRVMTPQEALSAGATDLVIGRPITGDPDPQAAARRIAETVGRKGI